MSILRIKFHFRMSIVLRLGARNLKFNRIYKFNTVLAPSSGAVTDGRAYTTTKLPLSNAIKRVSKVKRLNGDTVF